VLVTPAVVRSLKYLSSDHLVLWAQTLLTAPLWDFLWLCTLRVRMTTKATELPNNPFAHPMGRTAAGLRCFLPILSAGAVGRVMGGTRVAAFNTDADANLQAVGFARGLREQAS
jgi:hypothetical protein